ncbi:hypothetical protein GCM10022407_27490 [Hymenobacter antarcticus]|uniref:PKD domain-containing protein n=1 Tax=Hymenobacter antarcticus TaxID=486270 RepID=A0ABP7QDK0_9BACT
MYAGLEFSPDGSRLYTDTLGAREIWQYNLLAGNATAIAASRQAIPAPGQGDGVNALQLGPDGNVYVSALGSTALGRLTNTNASAPAVIYNANAVQLNGYQSLLALPSTPNDLNLPPVVISGPGNLTVVWGCAGVPLQFQSSLSPFVNATAYSWDFGDPASGASNLAGGQAPTHIFSSSGAYQVTLRVTNATGQQFISSQTVVVKARPLPSLGSDSLLCSGSIRQLDPGLIAAGNQFRWQDGSTNPTFTATKAGLYWVDVTNNNGCQTRASLRLIAVDCANLPNIITPNGDELNETFVLRGLNAPDWTVRIYSHWGQELYARQQYDNSWAALGLPDGIYYYLLTKTASGRKIKGWVEVRR